MPIKAVFFDFMGTCLDWHVSITAALPAIITPERCSELALDWRQRFFDRISARHTAQEAPEDIDTTFQQSLFTTLKDKKYSNIREHLEDLTSTGSSLIRAWHKMPPWPDISPALKSLCQAGLEVFVLANGTTRLQLDLVASAGLIGHFDVVFSSQMLGRYKPSPDAYLWALDLVGCAPEEAAMVACHAYDLRAAREVGMKTVYVTRWTDDINEDMEQVKAEFPEAFLENGFTDLLDTIKKQSC